MLAFSSAQSRATSRRCCARRRERRGEPRPGRRRARRRRGLRRRGPDDQALAPTRARPRRPDHQAHVPHHHAARDARLERQRACPPAATSRRRASRRGRGARPSASRAESREGQHAEGRSAGEAAAGARTKKKRKLMGQKVHPGGMRVGVIHDWKSNWYTGKKEFPRTSSRTSRSASTSREAVARGPLRHPDPQGQAAGHGRHLHRPPRDRDRQVGRRGRRAAQGAARDHPEERPHQHQRDQAPRARREARRAVDRRAAPEPRQLPPRDEALARVGRSARARRASRSSAAAGSAAARCRARESYSEGRVPLHTIRADIDYGFAEAKTTFGRIGVKVWINKGEIMPEGFEGSRAARRSGSATRIRRAAAAAAPPRASAPRARAGAAASSDREGLGPVRQRRRGPAEPAAVARAAAAAARVADAARVARSGRPGRPAAQQRQQQQQNVERRSRTTTAAPTQVTARPQAAPAPAGRGARDGRHRRARHDGARRRPPRTRRSARDSEREG